MSIQVNMEQYQFSHGHTPRGTGVWLFSKERRVDSIDFSHSGTYAQALTALIKYVKSSPTEDQTGTWYVCP